MFNYSTLFLCCLLSMPVSAQSAEPPKLTRAEAAMILLLSRTPNVAEVHSNGRFKDVPVGAWYERYVVMAERYKILTPDSSMRLHPEREITRAEFLKMIALTFGIKDNLPYLYRDVLPLSWYAKYAGIAEHYRIFAGDHEKNRLFPLAPVKLDEAAAAIRSVSRVWERERQRRVDQAATAPAHPGPKPMLAISTHTQRFTHIETQPYWVPRQSTWSPLTEAEKREQERNVASIRMELLRLTNAERRKAGVSALHASTFLEGTAQLYARTMAERSFFGHVSPDGRDLADRLGEALESSKEGTCRVPPCVRRMLIGENLARGQRTAIEVMRAWMESTMHREALLNPQFQEIGIGVHAGMWVQHFLGELKE